MAPDRPKNTPSSSDMPERMNKISGLWDDSLPPKTANDSKTNGDAEPAPPVRPVAGSPVSNTTAQKAPPPPPEDQGEGRMDRISGLWKDSVVPTPAKPATAPAKPVASAPTPAAAKPVPPKPPAPSKQDIRGSSMQAPSLADESPMDRISGLWADSVIPQTPKKAPPPPAAPPAPAKPVAKAPPPAPPKATTPPKPEPVAESPMDRISGLWADSVIPQTPKKAPPPPAAPPTPAKPVAKAPPPTPPKATTPPKPEPVAESPMDRISGLWADSVIPQTPKKAPPPPAAPPAPAKPVASAPPPAPAAPVAPAKPDIRNSALDSSPMDRISGLWADSVIPQTPKKAPPAPAAPPAPVTPLASAPVAPVLPAVAPATPTRADDSVRMDTVSGLWTDSVPPTTAPPKSAPAVPPAAAAIVPPAPVAPPEPFTAATSATDDSMKMDQVSGLWADSVTPTVGPLDKGSSLTSDPGMPDIRGSLLPPVPPAEEEYSDPMAGVSGLWEDSLPPETTGTPAPVGDDGPATGPIDKISGMWEDSVPPAMTHEELLRSTGNWGDEAEEDQPFSTAPDLGDETGSGKIDPISGLWTDSGAPANQPTASDTHRDTDLPAKRQLTRPGPIKESPMGDRPLNFDSGLRIPPPTEDPKQLLERISGLWKESIKPNTRPEETLKDSAKKSLASLRTGANAIVKMRVITDLNNKSAGMGNLPDYELVDVLGEGGMGIVYLARQTSIDRQIAIKMLKPDFARDEEIRARFLAEATATGDLDHPNIVPIHDLGYTEKGVLFYSMKRVQGTPWSEVMHKKTIKENLDILLRMADAVAFAHSRGIIHRDLKPENVMLGDYGEVLVMDWGLSASTTDLGKAFRAEAGESRVGTPAYMAPEMAAGTTEQMGLASDIYLLGATLYELITGSPPHRGATVENCLYAAARNIIQPTDKKGELVDISMKSMATLPADRFTSVHEFQAAIRSYQAHSESILLSTKAAEQLASARQTGDYDQFAQAVFGFREAFALWNGNVAAVDGISEASLAYSRMAFQKGDLDLAASMLSHGDPSHVDLAKQVQAGIKERSQRQARFRLMTQVAMGLAAVVVVVVTIAFFWVNAARAVATNEAERARKAEAIALGANAKIEEQRQRAEANAQDAIRNAAQAAANAKEATKQEKIALAKAKEASDNLQAAKTAAESEKLQREAADAARLAAVAAKNDAEQARNDVLYEAYVAKIGLASASIDENSFDRADDLLDVDEKSRGFRNWEWGRLKFLCRQELRDFRGHDNQLDAVAYSPDGKSIVTASWDGTARLWDAATGEQKWQVKHGRYVHAAVFSPDGKRVATGSEDGTVILWTTATGKQEKLLKGHNGAVLSVAFSKDGERLLSGSTDTTARIWFLKTDKFEDLKRGHTAPIRCARFAADPNRVLTSSEDGTVIVWDNRESANNRRDRVWIAVRIYAGHLGPVFAATFTPDGKQVLSASDDKTVRLWDVETKTPDNSQAKLQFIGHTGAVRALALSRDGKWLLTGGNDNTVRVWNALTAEPKKVLRGHGGWVSSVDLSPDALIALSGSHDHKAKLWRIDSYAEFRSLNAGEELLSGRFSADGSQVLTNSGNGQVRSWEAGTGKLLDVLDEGHLEPIASLAVSRDGRYLASGGDDQLGRIWSIANGAEVTALRGHTGAVRAIGFSWDGSQVVTGGADKTIRVWNSQTGKLELTITQVNSEVNGVAFSPDGTLILSGQDNSKVILWNAKTGAVVKELTGHSRPVQAVAFLADGKRVITASADNVATVWDWNTGKELPPTLKHDQFVNCLAVSDDSSLLVTGGADKMARVWDLNTRKELYKLVHDSPLTSVSISPDKKTVATTSLNSPVRFWNLGNGQPDVSGFQAHQEVTRLVVYVPGKPLLATAGGRNVKVWDLEQQNESLFLGRHELGVAAGFRPGVEQVVSTGFRDRTFKLWNLPTQKVIAKHRLHEHARSIHDMVVSPDGKTFVTGSEDGTAKLWEIDSGKLVRAFTGHEGRVRSVSFSTDGTRLVTGSEDRTARTWDVATGKQLQVFTGHEWWVLSARFSHDGTRILTASADKTCQVWDAETGQPVAKLPRLVGHTGPVNSAAFSPDGQRILSGSDDSTVKLWDATTGKEIMTLKGHRREVTCVQFSPNGTVILTTSRDGTAILWPAVTWSGGPEGVAKLAE